VRKGRARNGCLENARGSGRDLGRKIPKACQGLARIGSLEGGELLGERERGRGRWELDRPLVRSLRRFFFSLAGCVGLCEISFTGGRVFRR
jgi:hypothetical protein